MKYAICTVAAAPVRKEPSHRTEMINQLVFGERVEVLETKEEWLQVRSLFDGYEGWITFHLISEIEEAMAVAHCNYCTSDLLNKIESTAASFFVPMGSFLMGFDPFTKNFMRQFWFSGNYQTLGTHTSSAALEHTARQWLNVPYLWGGKTAMGVDCSGFVQTIFKVHSCNLKRDAYQQAEEGNAVENLTAAQKGDLAFFHNEAGKVTHVGLLLNQSEIIHAAGKVRIDQINENGIFNRELNKQTHQLHSIRRIIEE